MTMSPMPYFKRYMDFCNVNDSKKSHHHEWSLVPKLLKTNLLYLSKKMYDWGMSCILSLRRWLIRNCTVIWILATESWPATYQHMEVYSILITSCSPIYRYVQSHRIHGANMYILLSDLGYIDGKWHHVAMHMPYMDPMADIINLAALNFRFAIGDSWLTLQAY